jgi:hypothetical protein
MAAVMSKKSNVLEHVWRALRTTLTSHGFGRTAGPNAYRDHEATIDVFKVEFFDGPTHRVWGTSSHSFGLSCGVFLKFAPNPFGGRIAHGVGGFLEPDETVCAIRTHLFRKLHQPTRVPPNVWCIAADLSDLDAAIIDVKQAFESQAVPWFARFETTKAILELLQHDEEKMDGNAPCFGFGRLGSPVRNLYLGFAAVDSGDTETGLDALIASLSKGGFVQLSGSTTIDDLVRSKIAELQR